MNSLTSLTMNEKLQKLKIKKFINQCLLIITLSYLCQKKKTKMSRCPISQFQFKMRRVIFRKLSKKLQIMKKFMIFMFKFLVQNQNYPKTTSYQQISLNNPKFQNFSFRWMEESQITELKDQQTYPIFQFQSQQTLHQNNSHLQKVLRK